MKTDGKAQSVLSGLLEPLARCFTRASASEISELQPDEPMRRHMETLAEKCDDGRLSAEERAEYLLLVDLGDWMALLQARARKFLAEHPSA